MRYECCVFAASVPAHALAFSPLRVPVPVDDCFPVTGWSLSFCLHCSQSPDSILPEMPFIGRVISMTSLFKFLLFSQYSPHTPPPSFHASRGTALLLQSRRLVLATQQLFLTFPLRPLVPDPCCDRRVLVSLFNAPDFLTFYSFSLQTVGR